MSKVKERVTHDARFTPHNETFESGAFLQVLKIPSSLCALPPDANGVDLNPTQDTPVATRKEDTYIHFSVDVEIQRHVEKLPKGNGCRLITDGRFFSFAGLVLVA